MPQSFQAPVLAGHFFGCRCVGTRELPKIIMYSSAVRPTVQFHYNILAAAKVSVEDPLGAKAMRAICLGKDH